MDKFESLLDNDYLFLSLAACAVVIVPILGLYLLSGIKTVMAALP